MFIIVIYTTKLNRGNGIIVSYSGIVPEVATLGLLKTNQIWEFREKRACPRRPDWRSQRIRNACLRKELIFYRREVSLFENTNMGGLT